MTQKQYDDYLRKYFEDDLVNELKKEIDKKILDDVLNDVLKPIFDQIKRENKINTILEWLNLLEKKL